MQSDLVTLLTLKAPNQNCSRHFNFLLYLWKKIRLDFEGGGGGGGGGGEEELV